MDLTTLQTRCKTRFRDTACDIYNNAAWTGYLNDSYADVVAASPYWPFLQTNGCAAVTVLSGTRSIALPTDVTRVLAVRNNTDDVVMRSYEGRDQHFVDDPAQDLVGVPRAYRLFGSTIQVFPLPSANTVLAIEYPAPPTELTANSDEPLFPEQYHRILVEGALSRAYEDDGQMDQAASAKQRYDAMLAGMKVDLLASRTSRNRQIVDDWFDR